MASNPDRIRTNGAALAALLLSTVLVFLGTGIEPRWWALWLAPLPVLLIAPRAGRLSAFSLAALSWFLGSLNMWRYLRNILVIPGDPHMGPTGAMPVAVAVSILAAPACAFGLTVLLSRMFTRRRAPWRAALVVPAAMVSYEYLSQVRSPHSTFGNLAYSQMDFLPIVQVAAVTGVWGITFCVFLLPAAAAMLLNQTSTGKHARVLAAGVSAFLVGVMLFGVWRLRSTPVGATSVRVGLAASDLRRNVFPQEGPEAARVFREYADQAAALARQGARVIVLPEKLGVAPDPVTSETDAVFQTVADNNQSDIVVGLIRVSAPLKFNQARVYSPSASSVLSYDKHHLLPAFESIFQPGTSRLVIRRPSGVWGVAICKDLDFPELSRQYGAEGVGLLLVPAWDFDDDAWLHDRMAVMRGVESGFTIARAAKQGLLTVSDNRGRILAERSSAAAPFATLIASAPVHHEDTIYARFGDWFAWANLALLAAMLASVNATGRRRYPAAARP